MLRNSLPLNTSCLGLNTEGMILPFGLAFNQVWMNFSSGLLNTAGYDWTGETITFIKLHILMKAKTADIVKVNRPYEAKLLLLLIYVS